jgi:hypothetical protein
MPTFKLCLMFNRDEYELVLLSTRQAELDNSNSQTGVWERDSGLVFWLGCGSFATPQLKLTRAMMVLFG